MKKIILAGFLSLLMSPMLAKDLPSMCSDGTYAGGGECEIIVDGVKVDIGMEADDFFQDEEKLAEELNGLFKGIHDKMIPRPTKK